MATDDVSNWISLRVGQIQDFQYLRGMESFSAQAPHASLTSAEYRTERGIELYEARDYCAAAMMLTTAAEEKGQHTDIALFFLGLTIRTLGRADLAVSYFQNAFRLFGRLPVALLEAARSALQLNRSDIGITLFRILIQQAGDKVQYLSVLNLEETAWYQKALSAFVPRIHAILQPCAVLGSRETRLTSLQDRIVGTVLDQTLTDWEHKRIEVPPLVGRYARTEAPSKPAKILYVFANHINCSERFSRFELLQNLLDTSIHRGHHCTFFKADRILYGPDVLPGARLIDGEDYVPSAAGTRKDIARLEEELERLKPDWLFFESNFISHELTIRPEHLRKWKQQHKLKIITTVPDMYDNAPDFTGHWIDVADLIVCFHDRSERFARYAQTGKMYYFPTLPLPTPKAAPAVKSIEFCFVGSLTRERAAFLSGLAGYVNNHKVMGNGRDLRVKDTPADWGLYHRLLSQAKMTFNSGFIGHLDHPYIQTGRSAETMLAKTLLFEEGRRALEGGYVPYVHYIPVTNMHQLVIQAQFMQAHPDHRVAMTERAYHWNRDHFGPDHFWTEVEARLPL